MGIQYVLASGPATEPAPDLEDGILRLWAEVTNAGGAVGFLPPVTEEDVRPAWERHREQLAAGSSRLVLGLDEDGREPVALAFLQFNPGPRTEHWLWLYRVMVHPKRQGEGEGRRLMSACAEAARAQPGIQAIRLTARGGMGLERFYASCGYREVGRVPDGIKLSEDEYRDDVMMWLPLDQAPGPHVSLESGPRP